MKFSDANKQIAEIFEHWQRVMNHPRAKLDASRRRVITARLKEGYTVGQIKAAAEKKRPSFKTIGHVIGVSARTVRRFADGEY